MPSLNSNVQIDVLDTTDFTVGTFVDNATNGAFFCGGRFGMSSRSTHHADDDQIARCIRRCRYDDWLGGIGKFSRIRKSTGEPLETFPFLPILSGTPFSTTLSPSSIKSGFPPFAPRLSRCAPIEDRTVALLTLFAAQHLDRLPGRFSPFTTKSIR